MQLIKKQNFIIFLAALLVVALGFMTLTLSKWPKSQKTITDSEKEIKLIQKQSGSDDVNDIEKDLNDTNLIDIDKELQYIENEVNTTY